MAVGTAETSPAAVVVRAAWATLLVLAPGLILRFMGVTTPDRGPRRVLRVLGTRHLLQAVAVHRGGARTRNVGAAVDAVHASTDIAFAYLVPPWRRAAATDATITAGFVVLGITNV